jgi:hypothetical protein
VLPPNLPTKCIEITPEMIKAGLETAELYDDPGTFQPVTVDERALKAIYTAMRRLEASGPALARSTKPRCMA